MADEIRSTVSLSVNNGNFTFDRSKSFASDQTSARGGNPGSVTIGSTEEVINFGDIVTEGIIWIENLDSTNYIDYGPESGGSMVLFGQVKPGEIQLFRLYPGITFRAQASPPTGTAAVSCDAYIALMED